MWSLTSIFVIFFCIIGILHNRQNLMYFLIYMEMIILSLTICFTLLHHNESSCWGQVYSLYLMTVGAVESAILVTLVVQFFRYANTIKLRAVNMTKGGRKINRAISLPRFQ